MCIIYYSTPNRIEEYYDVIMSVCLSVSVCLHTYLRNYMPKLHKFFYACCIWLWICPPLAELQYVMYSFACYRPYGKITLLIMTAFCPGHWQAPILDESFVQGLLSMEYVMHWCLVICAWCVCCQTLVDLPTLHHSPLYHLQYQAHFHLCWNHQVLCSLTHRHCMVWTFILSDWLGRRCIDH